MAKDTQTKKRKASAPEAEIEQVKKVKKTVVPANDVQPKKRKATDDAAPSAVKKSKTPKSNGDAPESKPVEKKLTSKVTAKTVKTNGAIAKTKKVKTTLSAERISRSDGEESDQAVEGEVDDQEDMDSEVDDQTEALLKGFESEGDDNEPEPNSGFKDGAEVPSIRKLSKADLKKIKNAAEDDEAPGVVYVGCIPHGFYEHEMKEYFKQFGTITKIRLSRNRKTGESKHYAFIQFESATVADIVARTMDNYLLFGHILKVKTITEEQVPAALWKGANKRFKKVPWNKLEGRKLNAPVGEEAWEARREREEKRRGEKSEKMKEIGYEFEAPKIKSAKGVGKKQAITNGDSEVKAIEAAPAVEEPKKTKKKGKAAKEVALISIDDTPVANQAELEAAEADNIAPVVDQPAKPKKGRKAKATKKVEIVEAAPVEEVKPKQKKVKKTKVEVVEEIVEPTEAPEKKLKTKKSNTTLVEEVIVPVEAEVVKVKKGKKAKKEASA